MSLAVVSVADRHAPDADDDPRLAGAPTLAFGADLFRAVATGADPLTNVTVSPLSVAVALGLLEPGTVDEARSQLRGLLGIDDPAAFHASMNALQQHLEARAPGEAFGGDPGEVTVRMANAAYLQRGYPFAPAYLETVGRFYGPVLNEVDYPSDPDAVAHEINAWVAGVTDDRITGLVPDGTLTDLTVLTLVNALYLHASWSTPFDPAATEEDTFTRGDGTGVSTALMHGRSDGSARGDGWVGATKAYVGGLAAQFVLPDEGRFDEVAAVLPEVLTALGTGAVGAELALPGFETRFTAGLRSALQRLGLTALFEPDPAPLLGIAADERLYVSEALHETYVAMDEAGVEAAAATAVVISRQSLPAGEPVPVVLDRPFLFRILDRETEATLFLGRIMDPTA